MIWSTNLNARLFFTVASLTLAGLSTGCFVEDPGYETFQGPPAGDTFKPVSGVLERRCGTLDCHGSPYRPLRIYGKGGLRRPDKNGGPTYVSGGDDTTAAELDDNYQSVISLEPEIMQRVLKKEVYPELALTILRKPLLTEKHKGGPVLGSNSPGYVCLRAWLRGDTVPVDACNAER